MKDSENKKKESNMKELKELNVLGDIYYTTFTKKYEKRQPWKKPDEKAIISFIPGTVRQILIKEGDKVSANQVLLILEAMKMMNSIYAPFDGKIKSIKVKVGDRIPKGQLMIEFE